MSPDRLSLTFSALADPTRRAILERLASGAATVKELSAPFAMSGPAVSKHLRVLEAAGLVEHERRGTRSIYRLREDGLDATRTYLERLWGDAAARFKLYAENT
jgi:DNA-binding transcriptional ArsR family regulator